MREAGQALCVTTRLPSNVYHRGSQSCLFFFHLGVCGSGSPASEPVAHLVVEGGRAQAVDQEALYHGHTGRRQTRQVR